LKYLSATVKGTGTTVGVIALLLQAINLSAYTSIKNPQNYVDPQTGNKKATALLRGTKILENHSGTQLLRECKVCNKNYSSNKVPDYCPNCNVPLRIDCEDCGVRFTQVKERDFKCHTCFAVAKPVKPEIKVEEEKIKQEKKQKKAFKKPKKKEVVKHNQLPKTSNSQKDRPTRKNVADRVCLSCKSTFHVTFDEFKKHFTTCHVEGHGKKPVTVKRRVQTHGINRQTQPKGGVQKSQRYGQGTNKRPWIDYTLTDREIVEQKRVRKEWDREQELKNGLSEKQRKRDIEAEVNRQMEERFNKEYEDQDLKWSKYDQQEPDYSQPLTFGKGKNKDFTVGFEDEYEYSDSDDDMYHGRSSHRKFSPPKGRDDVVRIKKSMLDRLMKINLKHDTLQRNGKIPPGRFTEEKGRMKWEQHCKDFTPCGYFDKQTDATPIEYHSKININSTENVIRILNDQEQDIGFGTLIAKNAVIFPGHYMKFKPWKVHQRNFGRSEVYSTIIKTYDMPKDNDYDYIVVALLKGEKEHVYRPTKMRVAHGDTAGMWFSAGFVQITNVTASSDGLLHYVGDSVKGDCGQSIVNVDGELIGIHIGIDTTKTVQRVCLGVPITAEVMDEIRKICESDF
jgi:hypothetical protein